MKIEGESTLQNFDSVPCGTVFGYGARKFMKVGDFDGRDYTVNCVDIATGMCDGIVPDSTVEVFPDAVLMLNGAR